MSKKKGKTPDNTIVQNKRARFDFQLLETFEAGVALAGWEVKALRAGKGRITEAYVILKDAEAWLLGSHIHPLPDASTHIDPDPTRTRKLLLHERELAQLIGATEQRGYTLIPTALYWKRGRAKLEIALAKGKAKYDKRQDKKDQDWQRRKAQIMRS